LHTDTQKMIEKVESLTGYNVSIGSGSGFTGFAQMMTGTPQKPVHAIIVNQKYSQIVEYIVALQCAMLLIKWSDPKNIPVFMVIDEKVDRLIEEVAKDPKLAGFGPDKSMDYSAFLVKGLLQQLISVPSQMLAMDICRNECPGLSDMMETAANIEIKECHQSLEPSIRQVTPDAIFKPNASMNAAFALYWSRITGNEHVLLPFVAADIMQNGKALLDLFDGTSKTGAKKYKRTVDAWALKMGLTSLYEWGYMEK